MEKGIQNPMAQGRFTKIVSMIEWIRTRRLSKKTFSLCQVESAEPAGVAAAHARRRGRPCPHLLQNLPAPPGAATLNPNP